MDDLENMFNEIRQTLKDKYCDSTNVRSYNRQIYRDRKWSRGYGEGGKTGSNCLMNTSSSLRYYKSSGYIY